MAKLFIAVVPKMECERRLERIMHALEERNDCSIKVRYEAKNLDANYYELDFGKASHRAYAVQSMIEYGTLGSMPVTVIGKALYGLYRTIVKSDNYTLEQFIKDKAD